MAYTVVEVGTKCKRRRLWLHRVLALAAVVGVALITVPIHSLHYQRRAFLGARQMAGPCFVQSM